MQILLLKWFIFKFMTKYLGKIENDFDITNKKYVDELLQSDYEFKVFQQTFSQSGVNSYDKIVTIEEGWVPYGFFTVGTEGGVGYGYQSYATELISPTQVRCKGWVNVNGGSQIRIWLPCYRKKLKKNILAYTTEDVLWSGNITLDATCNLSNSWKEYDELEFKLKDGGSGIFKTVKVKDLQDVINDSSLSQYLTPVAWNSTDRRLIIFKQGTSETALKLNINGNIYITKIIGKRIIPATEGCMITKEIITGNCDGSGYFKINNNPINLQPGKILLSARCCTLEEGQSTTFWNILSAQGSKIIPLANPNNTNTNAWSILLRGWDDSNVYANMTNIKMEIAYA